MTVAVVRSGELLYRGHFGFEDREGNVPANEATIMRFASISKPITAVALVRESEAGRIDLDKPFRNYVPDWPEHHLPMTAAQILGHLSGIRHYAPGKTDNSTRFYRSLSDALNLFKNDDLVHPPGSEYRYSTHAYTLAGVVLERVSGNDFRTTIRSMLSSIAPGIDVELRSQNKARRSALYQLTNDGMASRIPDTAIEDNSWKYPGGGLEGTAVDLAFLGDAVYRGLIVSSAGRDLMWTSLRDGSGRLTNYGLGWALGDGTVGHGGSQQGARSALSICRRDGTVVVVLANTNISANPGTLATRLLQIWSKN